jgi:hypothetical protein
MINRGLNRMTTRQSLLAAWSDNANLPIQNKAKQKEVKTKYQTNEDRTLNEIQNYRKSESEGKNLLKKPYISRECHRLSP